MRQWEIYNFPYPSTDQPHPCVIISPDGMIQNPDLAMVNALFCQTLRPANRDLKPIEVRLNGADGLDRPTVVKCHFIHAFPKDEAGERRGLVGYERQQAIRRVLRTVYGI